MFSLHFFYEQHYPKNLRWFLLDRSLFHISSIVLCKDTVFDMLVIYLKSCRVVQEYKFIYYLVHCIFSIYVCGSESKFHDFQQTFGLRAVSNSRSRIDRYRVLHVWPRSRNYHNLLFQQPLWICDHCALCSAHLDLETDNRYPRFADFRNAVLCYMRVIGRSLTRGNL